MNIIKAVLYRVFRILLLLVVSYVVLGDIKSALSISVIDAIIATVYYYYFDVVWEKYLHPGIYELKIRFKYRKFK